jgi:hypothetical protein
MNKFFTRSLMVAVGLIAVLCVSTRSYAQTTFFFDNFETAIIDPTKWSQNPTNVPNLQSSVALDNSNLGPGGSQSAQQMYLAGWTDGGGVGWGNIGKAQLPSHALVEYDFKLSSNFHFPLGQKMWRSMPNMNTGQTANDVMVNNMMYSYGRDLRMEVFSNSSTYGYREYTLPGTLPSPVTTNVWHRVGYRYKKNTFTGSTPNADGEIELYYDGNSLGKLTNVRLTGDPTRWLRDYTGGPLNYTSVIDNNPIPQNQWIRIDNFKITDLGGSSVPPPPSVPPAPTGLIVQ